MVVVFLFVAAARNRGFEPKHVSATSRQKSSRRPGDALLSEPRCSKAKVQFVGAGSLSFETSPRRSNPKIDFPGLLNFRKCH